MMMDDYSYGWTAEGLPYPYGVSSSSSSAPYPSAPAPPFMTDRPPQNPQPPPLEFRDFFAESFHPRIFPNPPKFSAPEFDEGIACGSHRLHPAWPNYPEPEVQESLGFHVYHGLPSSPSPSSLSYPDVTGVGSCVSRVKDSYSNMFMSGDVVTSKGKHVASAGMAYPNENYWYESVASVPVSSSTVPESYYPEEAFLQPFEPRGYSVSSTGFHEKSPKRHYASHATMKAEPHLPVEPEINIPNFVPPRPMVVSDRHGIIKGSQIRSCLGVGEPLQSGARASNYEPGNFLGAECSLESSCIDPINFNVLQGCDDATGHIKPLFEGPDLRSRPVDSPCWKGHRVSHSPSFKQMYSSLPQGKQEGSSGSSHYQGPNLLSVDTDDDDDVVESSLNNPTDNLRCDANRFSDQSMASAPKGPLAPDLFSEESEPCDAMKVESRKAQLVVGQAPCLSDGVNQPSSKGVQANLDPCTNLEQTLVEDLLTDSSSEGKSTSKGDLGLEDIRSNVNDDSNCDSSNGHSHAVGDSPFPCSLKVDSVVKTMHNLSELLVYNCSNNGSMLKEQELETLKEVVNNLNNCLKNTAGKKAKTGEASLPKQALSESSLDIVKPLEVPKVAATDIQGPPLNQHVKAEGNQYEAYGYTERVKNDEMAQVIDSSASLNSKSLGSLLNSNSQSIKKILASNFPDEKETQPQIHVFKNLWLEAEAALCSTTHMARFYRVRNELESHKLCNTKETSSDAKLPSAQEQCPHPQVLAAFAMNDGEKTEVLVPDSSATDTNSYENNVTTRSNVLRSCGFNPHPVDELLADILGSSSVPPPDQNMDATSEMNPDTEETKDAGTVGASSHVTDVMDRFLILKRREEEHQPPNSMDSEENNRQTTGKPTGDSPDTMEASVVARFHILTSRLDHFTVETSTVKADVRGEDDEGVHGRGYESPSSDWEHVVGHDVPDSKRGNSD